MIRGRWSLPGKAFQLSTMIAIIDEKISVSMVEKALASFLEKGAGRKSPCDNCRDFYDNEYGSCAFGCSKLREFEGSEPNYDLLG